MLLDLKSCWNRSKILLYFIIPSLFADSLPSFTGSTGNESFHTFYSSRQETSGSSPISVDFQESTQESPSLLLVKGERFS